MSDYQKSRVYGWEDKEIAPIHNRIIKFDDAQTFVNGVWLALGLLYPPRVVPLPGQVKKAVARANRLEVQLPEETQAWVLVHELAHSLTGTIHESDEGHGPNFVGMYIKLLDKVLNIPLAYSMYSLTKYNIEYNLGAQPKFCGGGS